MIPEREVYGREGFEAYSRHAGGKSLATGEPLPGWDDLPESIREAWRVAGEAISKVVQAAS